MYMSHLLSAWMYVCVRDCGCVYECMSHLSSAWMYVCVCAIVDVCVNVYVTLVECLDVCVCV